MFEEMSDPVDLGRLVAGANVYPDPKRDGIHRFNAVGGYLQAVP
jgi:hypothetical protein